MMLTNQTSCRRGRSLARILPPLKRTWLIFLLAEAFRILTLTPNCLRAGEWQPTDSQLRLRMEPAADASPSARVGFVEISPTFKTAGSMGVFDEQGRPVGWSILWSPPDQPVLLCFDSSKPSKAYYVCYGHDLPAAPGGWAPKAGVLLETRPCAENQVIKRAQAKDASQVAEWISNAGPVQGREFVPDMRRSINPFGSSSDYLANFTGWFRVGKAGDYGFATDSSGPSIIYVDGRPVADWLGIHPAKAGRKAQHNGTIQLKPGMHCLQYQNLQLDGKNGCEVAWKPPGQKEYDLMTADDFAPVARFRVTQMVSTARPEQVYFNWHTEDVCEFGDLMILRVRFSAVDNGQARQYRWRFDDGSVVTGANVQHAFIQPGLRQITLTGWAHGELAASNTVHIAVTMDADQPENAKRPERSFPKMKEDLLRQDLGKMPANDLAALAVLAERANDPEFLRQVGKFMVQRAGEFATPVAGGIFYRLGLTSVHQGDDGDAFAKTCYQLALAPARARSGVAEKARLRLAELLLDTSGELDAAQSLLRQISVSGLSGEEQRLKKRLEGDLLLARGQTDAARKVYLALTPGKPTANADLARNSRIESVNLMLEQNQLTQAWAALDGLRLEFPLERLSPNSGLIEVNLAMRQKAFNRAFTACHRLVPLAKDDLHLPELLYDTVESGMSTGRQDDANLALKRLVKEFPYSEAAAKANSKWSTQ